MPTRRELLKASAQMGMAIALPSAPFFARADESGGIEVNDVQSQLNATRVHEIKNPRSIDDIQIALREAQRQGRAVSVAGDAMPWVASSSAAKRCCWTPEAASRS